MQRKTIPDTKNVIAQLNAIKLPFKLNIQREKTIKAWKDGSTTSPNGLMVRVSGWQLKGRWFESIQLQKYSNGIKYRKIQKSQCLYNMKNTFTNGQIIAGKDWNKIPTTGRSLNREETSIATRARGSEGPRRGTPAAARGVMEGYSLETKHGSTTLPHQTLKQADFLHSNTAAAAKKFLHVPSLKTRRLITVLGLAATLLVYV